MGFLTLRNVRSKVQENNGIEGNALARILRAQALVPRDAERQILFR
jgi:hypothetical protein